jgi:hypothetical protein
MKIKITGEDWVQLPASVGFTDTAGATKTFSDKSIMVGFTNSDLNIGPMTIQHKNVKDLVQSIASIKQSLDQVVKSAMSVIKETRT